MGILHQLQHLECIVEVNVIFVNISLEQFFLLGIELKELLHVSYLFPFLANLVYIVKLAHHQFGRGRYYTCATLVGGVALDVCQGRCSAIGRILTLVAQACPV